LEWLQSFTRYLHTPTPVHYDRERRVSEIYYELLTDCSHSKKTEEVSYTVSHKSSSTSDLVVLPINVCLPTSTSQLHVFFYQAFVLVDFLDMIFTMVLLQNRVNFLLQSVFMKRSDEIVNLFHAGDHGPLQVSFV